jgi:hypothetical protein
LSAAPAAGEPVPAGTPVDYTLTITNNDSANCTPFGINYGTPPSGLTTWRSLPYGFSQTLPDASSGFPSLGYVPAVAPGTTLTRVVQVTSSPSSQPGVSEFDFVAARELEGVAVAPVSYTVAE